MMFLISADCVLRIMSLIVGVGIGVDVNGLYDGMRSWMRKLDHVRKEG